MRTTGVFICRCGGEVDAALDVGELRRAASGLEGVALVREMLWPCSKEGRAAICEAVRSSKLDRVLVAGCTPRALGPLFRETVEEAGIMGGFLEMVNIREGCAWVHRDRARATDTAKKLVRMALLKLQGAEPLEVIEARVASVAVVIGAGVAGMSAALGLASRGIQVTLLEREAEPGGMLLKLDRVFPSGESASGIVEEKVQAIERSPDIELVTGASVKQVSGRLGDYEISFKQTGGNTRTVNAGAVVVATGARVRRPDGLYGYDGVRVKTQLELAQGLRAGSVPGDVVMIQCVGVTEEGASEEDGVCCGRVCCLMALGNAVRIKEMRPEARLTIIFRELPLRLRNPFQELSEQGVKFAQFSPDRPPEVRDGAVEVDDLLGGERLKIPYDLVALSTPFVPAEGSTELAGMLRIPVDGKGFLLERHQRLRPGDRTPTAVFLAGCAHWPADVSESTWQGLGAAARAGRLIEHGAVRKPQVAVSMAEGICRGCGRCEEACPSQAVRLVPAASKGIAAAGESGLVAELDELLCTGCGVCAALCPCGAISNRALTDGQLLAMLG